MKYSDEPLKCVIDHFLLEVSPTELHETLYLEAKVIDTKPFAIGWYLTFDAEITFNEGSWNLELRTIEFSNMYLSNDHHEEVELSEEMKEYTINHLTNTINIY